MSDKKHYIITAVTLGCIAAASGVLIGVTNLITKERIAQNEKYKIQSGIASIFKQNTVKYEEFSKEEAGLKGEYKYIETLYTVKDNDNNDLGCVFKSSGSNMYGKISIISGYDISSHAFMNLSVIVNEQTYATTLVDNYINPLNDGTRNVDDVSCGATYGAKLIRDMIHEAEEAAVEYWGA